MTRPELLLPPELYYDEEESLNYTKNSRIQKVQNEMTERSLEMLLLPKDQKNLILDIGCGSGVNSQIIKRNNNFIIGLDINRNMLNMNNQINNFENDLILCDIGSNFKFRNNIFDGVISISVIQWLFVANDKNYDPYRRLITFFRWLYKCLKHNSRACLQFYPENYKQVEILLNVVNKCKFNGGLVVDNPEAVKSKKYYLCIWTGVSNNSAVNYNFVNLNESDHPALSESEEDEVNVVKSKKFRKNKKLKLTYKDKILKKKHQQQNRGILTRPDSKYTGRKRPTAF